jgi:CRISPR-associated endonuclease/helicase Cas3
MKQIQPSGLKTILHSKRANIYYLELCRVLVNGGRVEYVTEQGKQSLYWNIPIANTTAILLGTGTSITQAAVRELAKAGVMIGFCGGGGTPLFAGTESFDLAWVGSQSEYRPTEYLQHWVCFWFDDRLRLEAAKAFQQARLARLSSHWLQSKVLHAQGFEISADVLMHAIEGSRTNVEAVADILDHSELLWIVGDRRRFNAQGAVPTNTTTRDILRRHDESGWPGTELIQLMADLAGLMHDLGKACQAFQDRLAGKAQGRNLIRHEWISLRLLQSFVGGQTDAQWLQRMAEPVAGNAQAWLMGLEQDAPGVTKSKPFAQMHQAPLAQAVGWLVLTHHRLPQLPYERRGAYASMLSGALNCVSASWNEIEIENVEAPITDAALYWQFTHGLPCQTVAWQARAARLASKLKQWVNQFSTQQILNQPLVMHLARLSLMLADHHYSTLAESQPGVPVPERLAVKSELRLYANTLPQKAGSRGQPRYKQTLEEHLIGVAQGAAEVARFLPSVRQNLPHLGPVRSLKKRSAEARFHWQNKAADLAETLRESSSKSGCFIVNMASTGCGKTLANARIMQAMSDPATGMRCAFAMGLRTLTLQTGQAFRDNLQLQDDHLAIRVGGSASRALFEHFERQAEATGSASAQGLMDEDGYVVYEGRHEDHPLLRRLAHDPQVAKLLMAPILVCTIDHLTPATEAQRGGRQIAPMLRLMSSDLVLDEPDDFDLADLPALTRLVNWAGLLGARVLLSSATLPPALIQGLFEAYRAGRQQWHSRTLSDPIPSPAIPCLWVDEFHQHAECCMDTDFTAVHAAFVQKRLIQLAQASERPRRRLELVSLELSDKEPADVAKAFASEVLNSALILHQAHSQTDPLSGKRVSFGLVRMANIERLFDVALALYAQGVPTGTHIHLCTYHSRFPLLMRSATERMLDACLKRDQPEAVFQQQAVRECLDASPASDQVCRDHDYDWAVVEPSSLRSLIQLLGRVRRHRHQDTVTVPNVHVFRYPLRHFLSPGKDAYCWPGFESERDGYGLRSHDLAELLPLPLNSPLDSRPRIQAESSLQPDRRWADLEHQRLKDWMLPHSAATPATAERRSRRQVPMIPPRPNAASWWNLPPADAQLTYLLQQNQPFRDSAGQRELQVVLLPDEDGETSVLHQILDQKRDQLRQTFYVDIDRESHVRLPDDATTGSGITPWGATDYLHELQKLATAMGLGLADCAKRFGLVTVLSHDAARWRSHPCLGFAKHEAKSGR